MSRLITVADPNPGWRNPLILGWAGMRGVVSLAAALSIPLLISEGQPFPHRNLILFITFIVILVTLVVQGLTLPWLIRTAEPEDKYTTIPEREQELIIQKNIAEASLQFLEEKYGKDRVQNEHLDNLFARLQIDLRSLDQELEESNDTKENSSKSYQSMYLELLELVRNEDVVRYLSIPDEVIDSVAANEQRELERRERAYRDDSAPLEVKGRIVILVDDGLATGSTMRAAVAALRQQEPKRIVVAVPVSARKRVRSFALKLMKLYALPLRSLFVASGCGMKTSRKPRMRRSKSY